MNRAERSRIINTLGKELHLKVGVKNVNYDPMTRAVGSREMSYTKMGKIGRTGLDISVEILLKHSKEYVK